jgi:signal transduction histidine kinase/response regulator RpfG family c-di-GMP phosphodiesterase
MTHSDEKASVLLVDDRPDKLLALQAVLSDMPVDVVLADSGREALRQMLRHEFAVVLLDVDMPTMDGFETAALIRRRKASEHIPIIFITAYSDEIFMERGYSLGAVDYILQPPVPQILRAKVSVFVDLFEKTRELRRSAEQQRQRVIQLQKLAAASVAINGARSMEKMLEIVTDTARDLSQAHQAITLYILDVAARPNSSPQSEFVTSFSEKYSHWRGQRLELDRCADTVIGRSTAAVRLSPQQFMHHPDQPFISTLQLPPVRGVLAAPLLGKDGHRIGILYLSDKEAGDFSDEDEAIIVQLAQMASIAMENATLFNAREANRAKDQFLATLSHELRTPLTPALAALAEVISDKRVPADMQDDLRMIQRNVQLEARLIDDLLDLTRVTKGKIDLHFDRVDAHALLGETMHICHTDIVAKSLNVITELQAERSHVKADVTRLQQALWNLLKNAVKFTPLGGTIRITSSSTPDGMLQISITDTGIGIEPEVLPRIFNAFEQGDPWITRQFGGLGLGLAITKAMVEAHHGTVNAASAGKDKGATFTLALPLDMSWAATPVYSLPRLVRAGPTRRLRILLVEDHADTSRVMSRLLVKQEHHVQVAPTIAQALQIAETGQFDLVISDIGLPDGSGLDLMQKLLRRQSIVGIALSGYGLEDDIRRSKNAGFREHLTKPVNFQILFDCIDRVCADIDPHPAAAPMAG